jgi:hypothetical protein
MPDDAYMVNAFDMSTVNGVEPGLQEMIERRTRLLSPAYKLFYGHPVSFVRAEGVHLYDVSGRAYLDAYNNVPSGTVTHASSRRSAVRPARSTPTPVTPRRTYSTIPNGSWVPYPRRCRE